MPSIKHHQFSTVHRHAFIEWNHQMFFLHGAEPVTRLFWPVSLSLQLVYPRGSIIVFFVFFIDQIISVYCVIFRANEHLEICPSKTFIYYCIFSTTLQAFFKLYFFLSTLCNSVTFPIHTDAQTVHCPKQSRGQRAAARAPLTCLQHILSVQYMDKKSKKCNGT